MSERVFFDTNILVYADDLDAGNKREIARERIKQAMSAGTGVVSTQGLQEFFVVTTRKLGVPAEAAQQKVRLLAAMDVVRIDVPDVLAAIDLHRLHSLSFWDALILRCATLGGCTRLLTEDLQDGRTFDRVRVENPFL